MSETAQRCAEVLARAFPEGGSWTKAELEAVLARPGGYLFENEGGFLVVQVVADEAEVWSLAVKPESRCQGHASGLIESAVSKLTAQAVKVLFLEVAADNRAALALYQKHGFDEFGRRKNYYRGGAAGPVDAILMRKSL